MKVKIIYPRWPKLKNQPEFRLPPHGPVVFAAALGDEVEISFCDEHVQELDFQEDADLIALSVTLTCQMPRAWEIADRYREQGTRWSSVGSPRCSMRRRPWNMPTQSSSEKQRDTSTASSMTSRRGD